ncbi:hypothetical protein [Pseudomonas costantinii]|uniref:hypothetical protein n=1 Tax=Pseudomonas costantinii TaxID=168469 RepID=UPI003F74B67B
MKVESANEMLPIQHLDQPVATAADKPAPVRVDELAHLFLQEVETSSRTLNQRSLGVRVLPAGQIAQLYDQLGHPAQTTLSTISRQIRAQLLQHPSVDKLLELTHGPIAYFDAGAAKLRAVEWRVDSLPGVDRTPEC